MDEGAGGEALRVFVGAAKAQWLPFMVLRTSILRRASIPVKVESLWGLAQKPSGKLLKRKRPRTPFSFQRFDIPRLCGYAGRAVYLDSDMIMLTDVAELSGNFEKNLVVTPPPDGRGAQFAVMVMDCAALPGWSVAAVCEKLRRERGYDYRSLMKLKGIARVSPSLSPRWNELDSYRKDTKLLHFTDMARQPWLKKGHPCESVWHDELRMALDAGDVTVGELRQEEELGHIRKKLLLEV